MVPMPPVVRRQVARMSHALSLLLADRKLVSFLARSSDNIEPERCSDSFVRVG